MPQWTNVLIAGGLMALTSSGPVSADPLQDGKTAFWHHDYETALRLLRPLGEAGSAVPQSFLGHMYTGKAMEYQ